MVYPRFLLLDKQYVGWESQKHFSTTSATKQCNFGLWEMNVSYLWKPNMEAERMDWLEHGIKDLTTKRAVCLPRRNFAPPSVTVAGNKLESSVLLRHF